MHDIDQVPRLPMDPMHGFYAKVAMLDVAASSTHTRSSIVARLPPATASHEQPGARLRSRWALGTQESISGCGSGSAKTPSGRRHCPAFER